MNAKLLDCGAALAVLVLSSALVSAQAGPLRAGVAKVDITPPKDLFPLPKGDDYIDVHDPLFARALVLDNGSAKVVLISVDSNGIASSSEIVQTIASELKIPAANIILTETRAHNTPTVQGFPDVDIMPRPPYFEVLQKGIVEAARQANANLQPARVGFGAGKAYVNTNRDQKIGDHYGMGYNPDGPSDKTVAVLLVTKPTGEPIAVYSSYAVHPVLMFRAKTKDGKAEITADLAGATSQYVEEHFPGAVALWTMGAAGDQNPLFMADYNQDSPDVVDEGSGGWAILDVQARRLGEEIVRVTKTIQNTSSSAVLWGAQATVTCPGQKRAEPAQPGVRSANVKMVDGDPVDIYLSLVMINDIAVAAVAGDVFTEIGEHLKRDSLFDRTFMVTTMPNETASILTDKAYLLPSQNAAGNRLKPGCAEPALIDGFLKMEKSYLPVWQAAAR